MEIGQQAFAVAHRVAPEQGARIVEVALKAAAGDDVEQNPVFGRIGGARAEPLGERLQQALEGIPRHRLVGADDAAHGPDQQAVLAGRDQSHQRHGKAPRAHERPVGAGNSPS